MFRHINIRNIFLTAGKQNSWLFLFWWRKLIRKKEKEKVLPECNRNAELLRLVGATFDSKAAFRSRMRKSNLIILKSLQKKSLPFVVIFICRGWHLSCQISIESVRKIVICPLNILMAVLYLNFFFLNIITICIFIEQ